MNLHLPSGRKSSLVGECDMFVPIVKWNTSLDKVNERLQAGRIRQLIRDSPPGTERSGILRHIPDETKYYNAVVQHELDHLRRQLSTTYGFLQRWLVGELIALTPPILEVLKPAAPAIAFPVLPRFLRDRVTPAGRAAWRSEFARCAPHECAMWSAQSYLATLEALEHGHLRGARSRWTGTLELPCYLRAGDSDCWPINVRSLDSPGVNRCPIGGRHLFEHMAVLETANWCSLLLGGFDQAIDCFTSETVDDYSAIFGIGSRSHPVSSLGKDHVRDDDIISHCYAAFPVEHYALIDLALMVPFTSNGWHRKRVWDWDDIAPGRRYMRLVEALHECNRYTPFNEENRNEAFQSIQAWMSNRFDWPSVTELIGDWVEALEKGVPAAFQEFPGDPAPKLALEYLRLKRDRPFDTVVNNINWGEQAQDQFLVWLTRESSGLTACPLRGKADAHLAFNILLALRGIDAVLTDGERFMRSLAPRHREHAFHILTELILTSSGSDSFVRELSCIFRRDGERPVTFP